VGRRGRTDYCWKGHYELAELVFGAYFEGHFVIIEPSFATKTPFRRRPSTTSWRPALNCEGTEPV
jgi:hypothetical protein